MASRKYPECGYPARLSCLENVISRQIRAAKKCSQVKKLMKRANYLVTLAHKRDVSWTISEAEAAKARLKVEGCAQQDRLCGKLTKSCKR